MALLQLPAGIVRGLLDNPDDTGQIETLVFTTQADSGRYNIQVRVDHGHTALPITFPCHAQTCLTRLVAKEVCSADLQRMAEPLHGACFLGRSLLRGLPLNEERVGCALTRSQMRYAGL